MRSLHRMRGADKPPKAAAATSSFLPAGPPTHQPAAPLVQEEERGRGQAEREGGPREQHWGLCSPERGKRKGWAAGEGGRKREWREKER